MHQFSSITNSISLVKHVQHKSMSKIKQPVSQFTSCRDNFFTILCTTWMIRHGRRGGGGWHLSTEGGGRSHDGRAEDGSTLQNGGSIAIRAVHQRLKVRAAVGLGGDGRCQELRILAVGVDGSEEETGGCGHQSESGERTGGVGSRCGGGHRHKSTHVAQDRRLVWRR
jgi:hypothetical protein